MCPQPPLPRWLARRKIGSGSASLRSPRVAVRPTRPRAYIWACASTRGISREGVSLQEGMSAMQPFAQFPRTRLGAIRFILTDVDDTLTDGARLPAAAYDALERLPDAGCR